MFAYQLSDMPGPTVEAQHIQLAQDAAVVAVYDAINAAYVAHPELSPKEVRQLPEVVAANKIYNDTINQLVELLGGNAPCSQVDTDLWETFSDCYKEDAGIRPSPGYTRADVLAYFAHRKATQEIK
jgi:hypothetical protein